MHRQSPGDIRSRADNNIPELCHIPTWSVLPVAPRTPPLKIGLWGVQSASHKVTGKRVFAGSFDKRRQEVDELGLQTKEHLTEIVKSEVSQGALLCWLKLKALPTSFPPLADCSTRAY